MKKFLITIDTEGDNLWEWKNGEKIYTENTLYLKRFQKLCNKYGFKPVWLTNYEMLMDERYVSFIKEVIGNKQGELGMHLHAWNTPPYFELPQDQLGAPYLIEYPYKIMEEKMQTMTDLIVKITGEMPCSHRAGRWTTNQQYFNLLTKFGYQIDCSVTPGINWNTSVGQTKNSVGSNYKKNPSSPYWITDSTSSDKVLEVPVTTRKVHHFFKPKEKTMKKYLGSFYRMIKGEVLWLRPNGNNLDKMLYLIDISKKDKNDYVMFMLHSSELMPGGSPTFTTKEQIDKLYHDIECVFKESSNYYEGVTLKEYYECYDS